MMRNLVGRVLTLSGLEIGNRLDAGNGAEALDVLDGNSVDLVFVDINMPVMNGEELVREMERREKMRNLPVVVISTDGTQNRVERMRELGVMGYLQKPFRPEELRDEVQRIMHMCRIPAQRIHAAISDAAARVLETMCFSCVNSVEERELNSDSNPLGVVVTFTGTFSGSLQLWASEDLATSLALSFLGSREAAAGSAAAAMLNELANMICGSALTALEQSGDFYLDSPMALQVVPPPTARGLQIDSDEGSMWVMYEMGQKRWTGKTQSAC